MGTFRLCRSRARAIVAVSPLLLGGCVSDAVGIGTVRNHKMEAPIIYSSPVRNSATPLNAALACFGKKLKTSGKKPLGIAIGDVKDYTGKQGQDEGFAITQGGALMAYSALGKMGPAVRVHERFDTRVAEAELVYIDRRQLGDGADHTIDDPATGKKSSVPWKPYFGGTIRQSDYFIVGGITELNYNIRSGGAEIAVSSVGPKARIFTMNIAVDLRIVGTQSLMVYDTVSVEKQISGYEIGFGIFRFFGSDLFDINVGAKNQEPLQLGVRTAIEAGILQLVATVAGVNPTPCVPPELGPPEWDGAKAAVIHEAARDEHAEGLPEPAQPEEVLTPYAESRNWPGERAQKIGHGAAPGRLRSATAEQRATAPDGGEFSVVFAAGSDRLDPMSRATVELVVSLVERGRSVNLTIGGRDAADGEGEAQRKLQNARIEAVVAALVEQGISPGEASLLWQAPSENSGVDHASLGASVTGLREIARIRVG